MKILAMVAIAIAAVWATATLSTPTADPALGGGTHGDRPITESDARSFTAQLVEASKSVDVVTFCDDFAADLMMCEQSLAEYGSQPAVVTVWADAELSIDQSHSGSMIVTFTRADGVSSAIEVVNDGGELRAVNPVFWAERTIIG